MTCEQKILASIRSWKVSRKEETLEIRDKSKTDCQAQMRRGRGFHNKQQLLLGPKQLTVEKLTSAAGQTDSARVSRAPGRYGGPAGDGCWRSPGPRPCPLSAFWNYFKFFVNRAQNYSNCLKIWLLTKFWFAIFARQCVDHKTLEVQNRIAREVVSVAFFDVRK